MEEVLAKYFSKEATPDERSMVESWRAASETNAKAFLDAKFIWLETQPKEAPSAAVLEQIIGKEKKGKQIPFILQPWVKYASAAILILAISLLFILNNATGEINYTNQKLADGSVVSLLGNSKIEIINYNDNIREVKVYGKAYFDVERDESRPFVIHTDNAEVKVLGTSFVVDATRKNKTEVCVESGLVELIKSGNDHVSVKLSEGEMGLVDNNNTGIIKKNNNDLNYLAWKTKLITFKQSSMAEVEKVIEEVYGIDVKFENPAFKNCKLTAKFNKKKAKDAIEIIARTFNVKYTFANKEAVLQGKGC